MKTTSEIDAYFAQVSSGAYSGLYRLEVNLLDAPAARSLTDIFSFHAMVRLLDGLVLDDPDTSKHHVLLRRKPFDGHVLYLSHDGDSRIVFPSLSKFLDTVVMAKSSSIVLAELHPPVSPHVMEQPEASQFVWSLLDGSDEDIGVALALIPSLDFSDTSLLEKLATHDDSYIVEALGEEIAKRPSRALGAVALLCSRHAHPQAAKAGAKALRAIGAES